MRFEIAQRLNSDWVQLAFAEGGGHQAAAEALAKVAVETGSYRVRPENDDTAEWKLFRMTPLMEIHEIDIA